MLGWISGLGIFFAFWVLNFCSIFAFSAGAIFAHPFSTLGCSIFAFTCFGATSAPAAFCNFCGAATTSVLPWTLVALPFFTACNGSAVWRSSFSR
ncbi:MAG: hypothetical protein DLM52_03275 [Chthoniobacterales bacterium]|nr:MAG: hypothetical protein DLM52_03275 [Chthoniobacterales bacterium]